MRILRRHEPGRKNVRKKQNFFVGKIAFDFQGAYICKRHANILRLASGIAPHHVRIAKETRAGVSINGLHEVCIRIGVVTGGPDLFPAKLALAAGDCEGHNYAVPTLEVVNFFTHFFDDAHEFVTENIPFFHGGYEAVKQM